MLVPPQTSFFDPQVLCPALLNRGSLTWLLAEHGCLVFPARMREAWERPGRPGRDPWPLQVMGSMALLRFGEEGMSRRAAERRLHADGSWRAAARLSWKDDTPGEAELRRFERFLGTRDLETGARWLFVWLGHVVRVCREHHIVRDDRAWVIDSTPMLCHGAVLDTMRFLGDEARSLARLWARQTKTTLTELSSEWGLPMLAAKSTKGFFRDTEWNDPEDRAEAVTTVAHTAIAVVERWQGCVHDLDRRHRKRIQRRCRNLLRKIEQDLEEDEEGRLTVARRVVEDRLVSRTDPDARHGRKSKRHVFHGFKVHVVGEAFSGLITAVCVAPANVHDSAMAHRLIRRAKALDQELDQVLGDCAYGAIGLHQLILDDLGVDLLGRPQPPPRRTSDRLRKDEFDLDFERMAATCPSGQTSTTWTESHSQGERRVRFRWTAEQCDGCPLRTRCLGKGGRTRSLHLHPHEQALREQRERWRQPDIRARYRDRAIGEGLIHSVVRHGCRRARAWGLQAAQVQAHLVALVTNLKILATTLAAD